LFFISGAESEGINTAENEASSSSTNERGLNLRRPKRAYISKGVYTSSNHRRDYVPSVNESKYSTAAVWVQAQILEEPVCNTCLSSPSSVAGADGFSLSEIANHIYGLGVPDALAGSEFSLEDYRL
jgi:hypothetical protein